ncbi:MAG: uracil-DNA glycosylase family protein [candidate division WWE3 bacterium]|nr:uracil-DNA glycosylase family protein [candidate division WWE3 bacterium]
MSRDIKSINQLWEEVHELNRKHFPNHRLAPILGGGQTRNPEVMFVFINPTVRNISSDPAWEGPRFPFIGTRQIWRVFHRAGLFDDSLISKIEENSPWPIELAVEVEEFLRKEGFYLTNLVKWTGLDGSLPDRKKIALFLPLLVKEVEIVAPKRIVTFGSSPFEHLTGQKIKLGDYFSQISRHGLQSQEVLIGSTKVEDIPCYFPVGRGNPTRAVEILKLLKDLLPS